MAKMHDRIRKLRSDRGMTLSQVADKLGVTEATAQRYESGKGIKAIPYEVIEKYANIFNCKPQFIIGWEDEIEEKPVETANIMADFILTLKEDNGELMTMLIEYKTLPDIKKAQVREYVKLLAGKV